MGPQRLSRKTHIQQSGAKDLFKEEEREETNVDDVIDDITNWDARDENHSMGVDYLLSPFKVRVFLCDSFIVATFATEPGRFLVALYGTTIFLLHFKKNYQREIWIHIGFMQIIVIFAVVCTHMDDASWNKFSISTEGVFFIVVAYIATADLKL